MRRRQGKKATTGGGGHDHEAHKECNGSAHLQKLVERQRQHGMKVFCSTLLLVLPNEYRKFLQRAGFPCLPFRNPSDHFLKCINSDFYKVKATLKRSMKLQMVKLDDPLEKIITAQAIQIILDNYRSSEHYQAAQARVQEISQFRGTILDSGGSQASFLMQAFSLTRRELNGGSFIICWLQVFHRERLIGHYGVVAFVVGNTLSGMPYLLPISVISGTICYYMVALHPGIAHYLFFTTGLYASVTVVESLFITAELCVIVLLICNLFTVLRR